MTDYDAQPTPFSSAEIYADDEIADVPCARCGAASSQQWQICAAGNRWHGICGPCGVALNFTVLEFIRHPDRDKLMADYAQGTEAQRATTAQTGVVHDGPVPKGCAHE